MNVLLFTDVNGWYGVARYAGTYRLASELRKHGYSCQVVDFFTHFSFEQLRKVVDKYVSNETLLVGFSTSMLTSIVDSKIDDDDFNKRGGHFYDCELFPQKHEEMIDFFQYIKGRAPEAKIVVGGNKVNFSQGLASVDYWVTGQADLSLVKVCDFLSGKIHTINHSRTTNGSVLIQSNQDYPFDDFHRSTITYSENDFIMHGEALPIEISRGCAFNCSFCTFQKKGSRWDYLKEIDVLRDELISNYEKFNITKYTFCDDTYNDSLEKVQNLHDLFISLPFKIEWTVYARLDLIEKYPQMRDLMLDSGCRSAYFGIETLHEKAASNIHKRNSIFAKKTIDFLNKTWRGRCFTSGSFIVGLPYEDIQSLNNTKSWVENDLPFDSWFWNALMIKKNTHLLKDGMDDARMANDPYKYGFNTVEGDFEGWNHQHMSKQLSEKIQQEYSGTETYKNHNHLWITHHWLAMMWNLGYSTEECKDMNLINIRHLDTNSIKSRLISNYYEKLMEY